ncbi:hypothetical protein [Metabacillus niabensis]|uniref:DUF5683 domain-containing protein n=1 Tax=Metabacillus niabensis TaxID=324854 RepID=A0ABT9Z581_9BACI|nr:hypothetical protein [Metabacillus niabensis]MDQ0227372.1 hypothetical protein [Metabacillus niabensis]
MFFRKNPNTYKSPIAALLWSITLPGFGHLYNRDYVIGILLIVWEITINNMTNLNFSLFLAINFELEKSYEVQNLQWGLFFPSAYAFSMWHSYNRAKEINHALKIKGIKKPKKTVETLGLFFGLAVGMTTGVALNFFNSPIYSGIFLGILFGFFGHIIEKIVQKVYKNNEND